MGFMDKLEKMAQASEQAVSGTGGYLSVRNMKVIDSWNMIVEQGAGKVQWVLDTTETIIKEAEMPDIYCGQRSAGAGQHYLLVGHNELADYQMFIFVRDFGAHLDVSWFVTIEPGILKGMVSKYATGNPHVLSQNIDLFKQRDLNAFVTVAHQSLKRVLDMLLEELKLDTSGLRSSKSKGFLSVW
jgi:hypothetical protein